MLHDQIISLTQELILFQSTADKPHHLQNIVDFCVDYFKDTDLILKQYNQNDKPSVVLLTKDTLQPDILMVGHLDVVAADQKDFVPRIKGNKLYGRGALDMKSQVAVMMELLRQLRLQKTNLSIGLMLTTDEEIGGADGVEYLVNTIGYGAKKLVIVPDGGDINRVIIKQKGVMDFKLKSYGKAAHGSRPWLGVNANEKLLNCLQEMKSYFPDPEFEDDWLPSLQVNKFSGGSVINQIPDYAEAWIDFRTIETKSQEAWEVELRDIADQYDVEMEVLLGSNCLEVSADHPYIQQYARIAEEVLQMPIEWDVETGGSDARFFTANGHATLITKPAGDNIHSQNEWVDISSLQKFYSILERFIFELEKSIDI